ncbi:F-box/kelch-repeat protein SKIP6-like [Cynara cardunculus var. scolymus]|uniref:F-box domain, cyclin-like protein n=1 Tax=Cynara cardunculus var. scolymus TaxID=59895 RepID=A0A118K566_CYNCS|nr:F-box/kelch-repeat protein SKIP6-like [Cynara cardunculus var. scolymus]KVI08537.1 F-box domain, cyclin-like protein [Cynara cardunculus var. scolymus]
MADQTSSVAITPTTSSDNTPPLATSSRPPLLIPQLPDDVAVQCIARVPRSYHLSLSLVSKLWRYTIRSPHFFATRSLLHSTQQSLYLNIRHNSSFKWYHHPNPNPTDKGPLSPLPPIPIQPVGPAYAVLGPKIYLIGGSINDIPSASVWILDCRVNKWEIGPKMRVGREFAAAETVNGKIYVMGGCLVDNRTRSVNWAEIFDPAVGAWCPLPSSSVDAKDKWMHANAVIDGKIYAMADRGGVVYDVAEMEWGRVPKRLDLGWRGRAAVIDGVLYCYDYLGKIRGYDVEKDAWKELRGVEKGLPKFLCGATMVDLDGRLCVVWECKEGGGGGGGGKTMDIMCAEIEVRKDKDGGLSGSILWVDAILSVPVGSSILHCMAVAL